MRPLSLGAGVGCIEASLLKLELGNFCNIWQFCLGGLVLGWSKAKFCTKKRLTAFFKIYKICILLHLSELKFLEKIIQNFQKFCKFCNICKNVIEFSQKMLIFQNDFLLKFWDCSSAKGCKSCRSWKMLSNAYFLAKFRFDTTENEPAKNLQNVAKS